MHTATAGLTSGHRLESVLAGLLRAGKGMIMGTVTAAIVVIAVTDGYVVGTSASLGLLYILPMMLAATVLPQAQTVALAVVCSVLRGLFDTPCPPVEILHRFLLGLVAYAGSGLMVTSLIRNRALAMEHLGRMRQERDLRQELQEQLTVLVESSPAAILTLDARGVVLACNRAADKLLLATEGESLRGRPIGAYLPVLADALKIDAGPEGLRTAAQCQGRRENGEIFLAHTWFSSCAAPEGPRLAAIVVDSSEEMRDREEQGLRHLLRGNRIAAAAVSHEVRNLCSAIGSVCSNLKERHQIGHDEDFQGLTTLVKGLQRIADWDLQGQTHDTVGEVMLQAVLDDLRIVIEPDWREMGGAVVWDLPHAMPVVLGERHGLLQAFLNLAKNSYRAVQDRELRELRITVTTDGRAAHIRFKDSGPGISATEHLFEPFHPGAHGAGLGLYVSRAVVRSYGGDLRLEVSNSGACFRVEAQVMD
jgi:two-component system sensor kinase FixL